MVAWCYSSAVLQFRLFAPIAALASICCYGQCPLKIEIISQNSLMSWANVGVEYEKQVREFKVKVQNISGKDIRGLRALTAYYDVTEDLHTIPVTWSSGFIKTGAETTLHRKNRYGAQIGWLVVPVKVLFEDGSSWDARDASVSMAGCYGEYWANKKHPRLTALPAELLRVPESSPTPDK